jgi:hypothetical protein
MENQIAYIIRFAVDAWQIQINRTTKLFDNLTAGQ